MLTREGKDDFNAKVDQGLIDKKYYLTSGYGNTYGRLERNKPSTTITNNLATPSALRCIHYEQNRALTPREGARVQSFPDWFHFEGDKANVTTQIGNAVPPLLAKVIAEQLKGIIENEKYGSNFLITAILYILLSDDCRYESASTSSVVHFSIHFTKFCNLYK